MSLRLDTKEGYRTVMSVYAPQTGCPEHEKDDFYFTLEEAISYYSSTNPEWWPIAALCVGKPCEFILFLSEFCAVAGFYVKDGSAEEALGREAYERTSVKSSSYLSVSEDDEAVETPDLK
ncbi:unnamed protein product [Heligmosomoides polygyrus]|uniref:CX domain-containing protein n=1 Tax=Heligmosomoides polygyrus TaxID=6339 RepID=A0A3P8CT92_HELPZ|nr:unnamed protein product [Heligmosomoides polygyrus]